MRRMRTVSSAVTSYIERPRASVEPSSERASTSRTSAHPFVMKRLTPFRRHWPVSSSRDARIWTDPRSEPASGSVSTMAPPIRSPETTRGRMRDFISSSPNSVTMMATISCKPNTLISDASARDMSSTVICSMDSGRLSPPYSQGKVTPTIPACRSSATASSIGPHCVTHPSWQTGPSSSASAARGAIPVAQISPRSVRSNR